MKYRIELAATAKADIRETTRYLSDEVSPAAADKWLAGLNQEITTLERQPLRCPVAAENDRFDVEIRQLLLGKRHKKYRVIFTICESTVTILYVRHTARDEIEP